MITDEELDVARRVAIYWAHKVNRNLIWKTGGDIDDAVQRTLIACFRRRPRWDSSRCSWATYCGQQFWYELGAARKHETYGVRTARMANIDPTVLFDEWETDDTDTRQRRFVSSVAKRLVDPQPTPLDLAETSEERERVQRAIEHLPANRREVVRLWSEGNSHAEVARMTGRSRSAASKLFQESVHTLRRQLCTQ